MVTQILHSLVLFFEPVFPQGSLNGTHLVGICLFGGDTVDGQNPAPPRMMIKPLFIGF